MQSVSVPDIDGELGDTRARVDTDSDSIDCSVDVVGEEGLFLLWPQVRFHSF